MERYKAQETDKGQREKHNYMKTEGWLYKAAQWERTAPYKWGVLLKGTSMAGKLG